jgi:hypothetical protein
LYVEEDRKEVKERVRRIMRYERAEVQDREEVKGRVERIMRYIEDRGSEYRGGQREGTENNELSRGQRSLVWKEVKGRVPRIMGYVEDRGP